MSGLEVSTVSIGYGRTTVVWDFSADLPAGSITCLVGLNGVGKTTLLRGLMGLLPIRRGDIRLMERSVNHLSSHERARMGIAYAPQESAIFADLTVEENLRLTWPGRRAGFNEARDIALEPYGVLSERLAQQAGTLSGGEQRMLILARARLKPAALLLIDEISEGVQPTILSRMKDQILAAKREGTTVLLVEQNVDFAVSIGDRYIVMKQGRMAESGAIEDVALADRIRNELLQ